MAKLLSKKDVMKVLTMQDTIDILEKAFADFSNNKAVMPQRTPISAADFNGVALFMPAYLKGISAFGAKIVTVYKDNPAKYNLPNIMGTILLLDEKTGTPLAIMEGGYLTAMRTGGAAGLSTKYLSRENSKVHTLFGTGGMARTHACAVDTVRNIEKLILYSSDTIEKKNAFKDTLKEYVKCEIDIAENPADAVAQADIVTLITSAKDPIVKGEWFKPGTHINGIGSHAPAMRELDSNTILKSKIICDSVDACKAEAGDLMIPVSECIFDWNRIHGSLGDVITKKISGRENDEEITLFKSVGLAIQDISTALNVYQKATELNVGADFDF
ncbi:MAG: ornithine cyclodeaminase family protein [bacterium]